LYRAVFQEQLENALAFSYREAKGNQAGLRLRLCFDANAAELADLPWEFLWAPEPMMNDFLALHAATPVVRYPLVDGFDQPFAVAPPLHILVMLSNPRDVEQLAVEQELDRLKSAVGELAAQKLPITLEAFDDATLAGLKQRLRAGDVHILHFIGHGFFNPQTGQGGLVFEDAHCNKHEVSAEQLWNELRGKETLRLVFLNACEGARSSGTDFFAGVAQQLVQTGVPAVLAMQFAVSDAAAIALAHEFYGALASGQPLDAALGEARRAIKSAGNELEWATPVLFTRQADLNLIDVIRAGTGALYTGPTHPKTKSELQNLDIRIPDDAVVSDPIFAPARLLVGQRVRLEGPVYAGGDVRIGAGSYLQGDLIVAGSLALEAGVIVEGHLWVQGEQLVLGDGCQVRGVVRANQVQVGARCLLTELSAAQTQIGRSSRVTSLAVAGDAQLAEGVRLGCCRVGGRLALGQGSAGTIDIQAKSVMAAALVWPTNVMLTLDKRDIDRTHLFTIHGDTLAPGAVLGEQIDEPVLITSLLDADLVQAIQECTTARPRLPGVK
ncbi:MAG: hypothetical protein DCC55_22805, partial [Chloroflexi bacterium]